MRDFMACLRKATDTETWLDGPGAEKPLSGEPFDVTVDLIGTHGIMAAGVEAQRFEDVMLEPSESGACSVSLGGWPDGSRVHVGDTVPGLEFEDEEILEETSLEHQIGLMLLAFEVGIAPDSPDRFSLRAITRAAAERERSASSVLYEQMMGLVPEHGTVLWDPALEAVLGPAAFEEAFKTLAADAERCAAGEEMLFEDMKDPFDLTEPYRSITQYSDCTSLMALANLTGLLPRRAKVVDLGGELLVKGLGGEELEATLVPEGTSAITDLRQRFRVLADEGRDPGLAHWLGVGPGDHGRDEGGKEIEQRQHAPLSQQCANARAACERDEELPGDGPCPVEMAMDPEPEPGHFSLMEQARRAQEAVAADDRQRGFIEKVKGFFTER